MTDKVNAVKHTPTPWNVERGLVNTEHGKLIAVCYPNKSGDNDAEHIVRCVNSHDVLVELLKRCEYHMRVSDHAADSEELLIEHHKLEDDIRQALEDTEAK